MNIYMQKVTTHIGCTQWDVYIQGKYEDIKELKRWVKLPLEGNHSPSVTYSDVVIPEKMVVLYQMKVRNCPEPLRHILNALVKGWGSKGVVSYKLADKVSASPRYPADEPLGVELPPPPRNPMIIP